MALKQEQALSLAKGSPVWVIIVGNVYEFRWVGPFMAKEGMVVAEGDRTVQIWPRKDIFLKPDAAERELKVREDV